MNHVLFKDTARTCHGRPMSPVAEQFPAEKMREAVTNGVRREGDNRLKKGNLEFGFGIKWRMR